MREDLSPDATRLERHCRALLANGCDGINLLGTTGEATSLSIAQRIAAMETIAASGLPLERFMVGTGASALADATTLTRAAAGFGFAGALVIPPFYYKEVTEDGVFAYYARLIDAVARPIGFYLYNFPALSGVPVTLPLIERLMTSYGGVIAGLKDSSGDMEYAQTVARSFPDLDVFPSSETVLANARRDGYAGCISATVNVTAPLAGNLWRASREVPDRSGAGVALSQMRAAIARYPLVPALRHLVAGLSGERAWLRFLPPLAPLEPADARALDAAFSTDSGFDAIAKAFAHNGDAASP